MEDTDHPLTDHQLVLDCIAEARRNGVNDADLRAVVNEAYVKAKAAGPSRGRSRLRTRSAAPAGPALSNPLRDPRFVANTRTLAEHGPGRPRVIGGQPVPKGVFLHCVAVGSGSLWACTGTLIAPQVVVTAGHCSDYATRIFVGEEVPKGLVVGAKPVRHPGYNEMTKENDLTVMLLDEEVDVTPCRIAPASLIDAAAYGRVVGFGNTDPDGTKGYGTKLWVDVPIASTGCGGEADGKPDREAYACFLGRELVAGKPMLAKDSCTGDSGGPFYLDGDNDEWFVAGATSRAVNGTPHDCGDGGVYVRLDAYRTWIESVAKVSLA